MPAFTLENLQSCQCIMGDSFPNNVQLGSYYIGKNEVTQAEWKTIMGNNPSSFKCDNCPVEQVSWKDCQNYIKKLNESTGKNYRLPTEAEWEFAARSRGETDCTRETENDKGCRVAFQYSGSSVIDKVAWYSGNSNGKTHIVGNKKANLLNINDMSGNVAEWCSDWYDKDIFNGPKLINPQGSSSGTARIYRGGSWNSPVQNATVSIRNSANPNTRLNTIGFRLAHSLPYEPQVSQKQLQKKLEDEKAATIAYRKQHYYAQDTITNYIQGIIGFVAKENSIYSANQSRPTEWVCAGLKGKVKSYSEIFIKLKDNSEIWDSSMIESKSITFFSKNGSLDKRINYEKDNWAVKTTSFYDYDNNRTKYTMSNVNNKGEVTSELKAEHINDTITFFKIFLKDKILQSGGVTFRSSEHFQIVKIKSLFAQNHITFEQTTLRNYLENEGDYIARHNTNGQISEYHHNCVEKDQFGNCAKIKISDAEGKVINLQIIRYVYYE